MSLLQGSCQGLLLSSERTENLLLRQQQPEWAGLGWAIPVWCLTGLGRTPGKSPVPLNQTGREALRYQCQERCQWFQGSLPFCRGGDWPFPAAAGMLDQPLLPAGEKSALGALPSWRVSVGNTLVWREFITHRGRIRG